jgi:hypothetical protein
MKPAASRFARVRRGTLPRPAALSVAALRVFVGIAAALDPSSAAPSEPGEPRGELTIYRAPTRIGIVAKRELRDAQGRTIETTYYRRKAGPDTSSPPTESDLTMDSVVRKSFDSRGRLAFQDQFAQDGRPMSLGQFRYDENGRKEAEMATRYSPRGVRTEEARYDAPGRTTILQCDGSGRILEITGAIPPDLDLPGGFGAELGGLSLHLAASRERGPLSQISLLLSVRNRGESEGSRGLRADDAPLEVRDAKSTIVPETRGGPPREADSPADADAAVPAVARNQIAHVREYVLEELYGTLAPGSYTAVARQGRAGGGSPLVSNTVSFTIDP